jgi:hypothetical protein
MRDCSPNHLSIIAWTAFILLATVGILIAQTGAPQEGMSAFGKMVPSGFINRDVIVPSFNGEGRKTSELRAETLTRIDDDRLQIGKISIEIYAAEPAKNIRVDLIRAVYHMKDEMLRSGERSVVKRSDFETSGDSMVFDSHASVGSMKGRVRTLIFDTSSLSGKSGK